MNKRTYLFAALSTLLCAGVAQAQYPMVDKVAAKIIQKYQTSTCEQLWAEKAAGKQPPSEMEQRAIAVLRSDPAMRAALFNQISAPIVSKMFECGMIP